MVILNEKFEVPSLRELLQVRIAKAAWDSKTPLQKWGYLYSIGRVSLNFLGFPIFRDDPSLYWFSYVFFVYMGVDMILVIYTAYRCLYVTFDFGAFLPCTALLVGPLCCVSIQKFHSSVAFIICIWFSECSARICKCHKNCGNVSFSCRFRWSIHTSQ